MEGCLEWLLLTSGMEEFNNQHFSKLAISLATFIYYLRPSSSKRRYLLFLFNFAFSSYPAHHQQS
jgi:hypothetical protein